jgi:Carboxypeptidase regulatory-like domain
MRKRKTKRTRKKTKRLGTSAFPASVFLAASIFFAAGAAPGLAQGPVTQAPVDPAAQAPAERTHSSGGRAIEGTVLGAGGAPVPGAIVQIKDSKTLQVRSYIAQQDGKYHFWGLGTEVNYQLRAEAGGLASKTKTVSVFNSHPVVTLNLKLTKKSKP